MKEILTIVLQTLTLIVGAVLSIIDYKSKRKKRIWITLLICLVIGSLIPSIMTAIESRKREQDDTIASYRVRLNDDSIMHQLRLMALRNSALEFNIAPTPSVYHKDVDIYLIKIFSPAGVVAKYKAIDPSEYGAQNITPLVPVRSRDSIFYIGAVSIPKGDYSKSSKIVVITKYNNGLFDFERLRISDYPFALHSLDPFQPVLLTNHEQILLIKIAAKLIELPLVTFTDDDQGVVIFGDFENKERRPWVKVEFKSGYGGATIHANLIPQDVLKIFSMLIKDKLTQMPSKALKEIEWEEQHPNQKPVHLTFTYHEMHH